MSETTEPPSDASSRVRRALVLLAAALGFAVVQLDVTVVNVAIRAIGADLGGEVSGLQWAVNAYTVALAAFLLSAGALGDRVGAKRVFIAGFAVFTTSSAVCASAPSLEVLVGARAVQGIGAAALIPASLAIVTHAYRDPAARARAIGIWAACASVALSGGPLVGGLLIPWLGWRSVFLINVPLGALGIVLTALVARETSRTERRIDVLGQVLAVVSLGALAGATIEGGRIGFAHPAVLAGYAVAVLSGAAFAVVERRRRDPMLPLDLFRSRVFSASAGIGLLINTAFYGLIFVLSLYFQSTLGFGALATGLAFLPTTLAVLGANLVASRVAAVAGTRPLLIASAVLVGASAAGLVVAGPHTGYPALVAQLVGVGLGLGLIVPVITAAMVGSVDARRAGAASGVLNAARQSGSVLGVALLGSLAAGHVIDGLRVGALVIVGLALGCAVLASLTGTDR